MRGMRGRFLPPAILRGTSARMTLSTPSLATGADVFDDARRSLPWRFTGLLQSTRPTAHHHHGDMPAKYPLRSPFAALNAAPDRRNLPGRSGPAASPVQWRVPVALCLYVLASVRRVGGRRLEVGGLWPLRQVGQPLWVPCQRSDGEQVQGSSGAWKLHGYERFKGVGQPSEGSVLDRSRARVCVGSPPRVPAKSCPLFGRRTGTASWLIM